MTRETITLRVLLGMLLFALLLGAGLLYLASLESARNWPELAHLRLPTYVAVMAGLVPVIVAVKIVFDFLTVVEDGEAFSAETLMLLRRLRLLIGGFAGYFALGLAGFWTLSGLMHPTLLFAWIVLEIAALFLFTVVALFERIFGVALELREDNELTV